eukprot:3053862-Lingulodinium_polyedra.AAC.1
MTRSGDGRPKAAGVSGVGRMVPRGSKAPGIQVAGSSKWRTASAAKSQLGGKGWHQQRTAR